MRPLEVARWGHQRNHRMGLESQIQDRMRIIALNFAEQDIVRTISSGSAGNHIERNANPSMSDA